MGTDARLDHIYPVSKGGLSVPSQLGFVCPQCNQKKSDMTLAAFAKAYKLDREAVEAKLCQLGNRVLLEPTAQTAVIVLNKRERGQTVDWNSSWAHGSRALAVLRWSWL